MPTAAIVKSNCDRLDPATSANQHDLEAFMIPVMGIYDYVVLIMPVNWKLTVPQSHAKTAACLCSLNRQSVLWLGLEESITSDIMTIHSPLILAQNSRL